MSALKIDFISSLDIDSLSHEKKEEYKRSISDGKLLILKNYLDEHKVEEIKKYLTMIGQSSFPNYQSIERNCPNFHRLNRCDPRAYVKGAFHQFVFFPWNQDVFNFFEIFKKAYNLKNILSNVDKDQYLGDTPDEECIARLAFQFYPRGEGFLNKHRDPVDYHQLVVPVLIMSKKGREYENGGLYVEDSNGAKVYLDDICDIGDILYFRADMIHGVDPIDPSHSGNWLDFKGRWMGLLAVNKLSTNTKISNAKDLDDE